MNSSIFPAKFLFYFRQEFFQKFKGFFADFRGDFRGSVDAVIVMQRNIRDVSFFADYM